ncbi:MAG: ribosome small subunit-dependent GTPase A [Oscillospiraceae bacterium]|nr:ribosome small subunit-dependent GTPase A [Oscillospiraceae bacterium]
MDGIIVRALAGFYYVRPEAGGDLIECRARGKFRLAGEKPLVGDKVTISMTADGKGVVETIHSRKNAFVRPPVANIDCMILLASGVNPITDPFLIDRITAIAEVNDAECIICINKTDLHPGDDLFNIYTAAGFHTIRTSAVTGEGVDELRTAIKGKVCAFVGNSGVGKSSILNALEPGFTVKTAEVSEKLGRGRHTTRHVELFPLSGGAEVADTPGFSSFDIEKMELTVKETLQYAFLEFAPYLGHCEFRDCAHLTERGCAVLEAKREGKIEPTRHASYVRLYNQAKEIKPWERK